MNEKTLKTVMFALAAVAVALGIAFACVWNKNHKFIGELETSKAELTEQLVALQNDYESLSSDYEAINDSLKVSQEEVAQLIEKVKSTKAANAASYGKIRQYEKELGTLRSIMRGYISQIDSLNTLNKRLAADADAAKKDAAEQRKRSESLSKQVDDLSSRVAVGAVVKSTGLSVAAINASGKSTDRSSRVIRFQTSITLVANELASAGYMRVYIVITDPNGNVLTNNASRVFSLNGQSITASASREVEYTGEEIGMTIYFNDVPADLPNGIYTVDAYTEQTYLGQTEILLR